jgi:hypothetical protein
MFEVCKLLKVTHQSIGITVVERSTAGPEVKGLSPATARGAWCMVQCQAMDFTTLQLYNFTTQQLCLV